MFFGLSWQIPGERRECFPAKPMRLVFLWEAESQRQGRMVMLKMQCTAKPVAPRCDG